MSDLTQVMVVHRVQLPAVPNEIGLLPVIFDAVLLTVQCDLGTRRVRARVAAHRNKPER